MKGKNNFHPESPLASHCFVRDVNQNGDANQRMGFYLDYILSFTNHKAFLYQPREFFEREVGNQSPGKNLQEVSKEPALFLVLISLELDLLLPTGFTQIKFDSLIRFGMKKKTKRLREIYTCILFQLLSLISNKGLKKGLKTQIKAQKVSEKKHLGFYSNNFIG